MSVQFRAYDEEKREYISINDHGGMYLYQPTSRYTTKTLIVASASTLFHYTKPFCFLLLGIRLACRRNI